MDVIPKLFKRNTKFRQQFIPREFRLSSYVTQSFVEWWDNYYTPLHHPLKDCFDKLLTEFTPSVQTGNPAKKSKGMHLREIQAFEKYFKVKWNPKYPKSVIREAELVLKKK